MSDEPQWLTPEEHQAWIALSCLMVRLPSSLNAQLVRDAGISHFEYTVMAVLSEAADATMRLSELAMVADGSLPRLSQVVTRLEKRGWVTRAADPTDGRYTLATLTADGWDKVVASAPGHVAEVRRLVFDPLTRAQVQQVDRVARRILGATDPGAPIGPPG